MQYQDASPAVQGIENSIWGKAVAAGCVNKNVRRARIVKMTCDKTDTMNYVVSFLEKLVNTPSPSGFTDEVMALVEKEAAGFGFRSHYSRKGGLIIEVPGIRMRFWGFPPMWIRWGLWFVPSALRGCCASFRWADL